MRRWNGSRFSARFRRKCREIGYVPFYYGPIARWARDIRTRLDERGAKASRRILGSHRYCSDPAWFEAAAALMRGECVRLSMPVLDVGFGIITDIAE
jgi:hypothetical protein